MIGLLKKLFGAKPVETTAEVPYKVEAAPAPVIQDTADIAIAQLPDPTPKVEPVKKAAPAKKAAPKKAAPAKKPTAPKKPKAKPAA